jgi:hypothetical protein
MSNEEFERQMEFILQQQARFETNLEDQRRRSDEDWARQKERNAEVDHRIAELVASLSLMREAVVGLTHHVERHDYEMAEIRRTLAEQAERGKETDFRLNALMVVVERHISGHQSST